MKPALPVLDFAAFSGTGKTTLLRKLIPLLSQQGLRVAHHQACASRFRQRGQG